MPYPRMYRTFHLWFFCIFFVNFVGENTFEKFCCVFDHFSWSYEVPKFWMINLYLDVSGGIHANEYTKHANRGLHVNFWNFWINFWNLMPFSFMMKKDNLKHKLLLLPQVPFKLKCAEFDGNVNFFSFTPEIPFFDKFRTKFRNCFFLIWSLVSM